MPIETKRCYQLIYDEGTLRGFFQLHFYAFNNVIIILTLVARRKYYAQLSNSTVKLGRELIYLGDDRQANEDNFIKKVKKFQIEDGLYEDKGKSIPAEGLVLYVSLNPMSELKGYFGLQKESLRKIEEIIGKVGLPSLKVISTFKSQLHKCGSHKTYLKLDIDTKDPIKLLKLKELMKMEKMRCYLCLETHHGYHLVMRNGLDVQDQSYSKLYELARGEKDWLTVEPANSLLALAGTYQGDFPVKINYSFD